MQLKLTPALNLQDVQNKDYAATMTADLDCGNDTRIAVRCSDATFGNRVGGGVSARDVVLRMSVGGDCENRMKNGSGMAIEYDVDNQAPTVEVNSRMTVKDKGIRLAYRHGLRKNLASLHCEMDLDDKTRIRANYHPDAERFNLRDCVNEMDMNVRYEMDDKTVVEPGVNMRNKTFNLKVTRKIDDDQKVSVRFDSHTKDGVVGYTRRMNDGDLKVHATMNMGDGMGKNMPRIHVQKEWAIDI